MEKTTNEFVIELKTLIDQKRSFGGHPFWKRIEGGGVSSKGLQIFAVQFFLQVREFPRAISAMHANCPYPEERAELAENLYEEETGRISGCNVSHPELFMRFTDGIGIHRREVIAGEPLPGTAALIDWFELSSKQRSYLEGAAAMTLAAEGQVPGTFGPFARSLQNNYDLSEETVSFWDVHEVADKDHSDVGNHIVVRQARSEVSQERARAAVKRSLEMWWHFFDGIQEVVDGI